MTRVSPAIHAESAEARNTAAGAMSTGSPMRPSGVEASTCLRAGHKDAGVVDEDVEASDTLHHRLDQSVDLRRIALASLEGCGPNALVFEFMVMVHRADASRSPLRAGQPTWVALVAPLRQLPRPSPCP